MDVYSSTLFKDLEKLNYTVNESKVYLTLIKIGSSLAGEISKKAQLDRSSTYNALKGLIERGVVSTVHENKRTIFVPENPKKIIDYFQEKEAIAKEIIPRLQEQYKFKKPKSTVKFFQGNKGIKTIFQDVLDTCNKDNELLVLSSEGKFSEKMPYYQPIFTARKEKKKVPTRLLVRQGRKTKQRGKFTKVRRVPSSVGSPATINIYDDKVAILMWDDTPQGILIENPDVSETFRNYFNFMWKNGKSS